MAETENLNHALIKFFPECVKMSLEINIRLKQFLGKIISYVLTFICRRLNFKGCACYLNRRTTSPKYILYQLNGKK